MQDTVSDYPDNFDDAQQVWPCLDVSSLFPKLFVHLRRVLDSFGQETLPACAGLVLARRNARHHPFQKQRLAPVVAKWKCWAAWPRQISACRLGSLAHRQRSPDTLTLFRGSSWKQRRIWKATDWGLSL